MSGASKCAVRASCPGYFAQPEQTRQALSPDGWLDTGDIGYLVEGSIVVTGRHKDMIIINGRNIWPQDIEHIAERQPELRSMDASAFFVLGPDDEEIAVVVVQCNISDAAESRKLTQRLHREIHEELGISCLIELVPRHTLPRTSSGKLSRAAAREDYLAAARAGAQSRAHRRRQAGYGEQASLPAAASAIGSPHRSRAACGRDAASVRPLTRRRRLTVPSHVALTGATGFIGAACSRTSSRPDGGCGRCIAAGRAARRRRCRASNGSRGTWRRAIRCGRS